MKKVDGTVTTPKGFFAGSAAAGIKYENRTDMALIFSKEPCNAAGVFTSNVVKAAPVLWDKNLIEEKNDIHAIVVNSGIANACTGKEGMDICKQMAKSVADNMNIDEKNVLVSSTGVIGFQIPMEKAANGIKEMSSNIADTRKAGNDAAKAIMTTDTHEKELCIELEIDGKICHIGAIAKGSGMIHPNMCTMLCFVTSDVSISKGMLQKALSSIVIDTFNMISVDGDTSTNDSLMVIANGLAKNKMIDEENDDYKIFYDGLFYVCKEMAMMLAGDGEGATALFEVDIKNADSKENARTLAKSVICSNLTKAAIFGHDANWGRILCALGYSGASFDPDNIELFIESSEGRLLLFKDGKAADYSEDEASKILSKDKVSAIVDMHMGSACASAWGCDLTYDYVKINADYRS